jgi:hypothetical protein
MIEELKKRINEVSKKLHEIGLNEPMIKELTYLVISRETIETIRDQLQKDEAHPDAS